MTTEQLNNLIDGLAEDLKDTVAKIEASIPTTQHHYGDYGSLISRLSNGSKNIALLLGKACIKAGANPIGVNNAINLFC